MSNEIPLIAYRCKQCGNVHYPFHDRCLRCKGRRFEPIHPAGKATLLTYTAVFNLPSGFDEHCLVLGLAEFENNVRAVGQINVDSIEQLKTGMSLKPTWGALRFRGGQTVFGLKFEPLA